MRTIVVRMSKQAAYDMKVAEGEPFVHAGREGRVVSLSLTGETVLVELEVPAALTGVPGEPPESA